MQLLGLLNLTFHFIHLAIDKSHTLLHLHPNLLKRRLKIH